MREHPTDPEARTSERSQVPARWIDTIRFTLADIIARGEWDDFGIFRILNRVSFVCRNHLMFVVGFRRELGIKDSKLNNKNIVYSYEASPLISSIDPVFSEIAFDSLFKSGITDKVYLYDELYDSKTKRINLNPETTVDFAIPIWGSRVFIIAMELHVAKSDLGSKPDMRLDVVRISSNLGSFIYEALKPFDGEEEYSGSYPEILSSRMFLPKETAEKGLMLLRQTQTLQRAPDDYPVPLDEWQRIAIQSAVSDVGRIVEDEYVRLKRSPLLNSELDESIVDFSPSTNVMFIGKVFDSEKIRYKHYRYNAHLFISEEQWKDIREALKRAKREDFIPFDGGSIDNQFWKNSETNEGRLRIERAMQAPMASNVRLFVESVLMSGTTLIKPGVFDRRAIGWIDINSSRHEQSRATFYLACLHFVLQLGSPVRPVDAHELALVVLPFRCSGGIWMCATYVRDNCPGPIPQLVDQKRFEESALIYHSLFRETERRLRRRARGRYTDALGKLIARETVSTRWRKNDEAILCLDADSRDSFTQSMRLLTRVYPFDGVELVASGADRDILPFTEIAFRSRPNGFFDRLTLHGFLRESENLRRLRERILLASVLIDEEDHE